MKKIGMYGGKFLPFHHGHIYVIQQAFKHVDKLYIVLSSSVKRDTELCDINNTKYMPADIRLSWLGRVLNYFKTEIEIIHVEDSQGDDDYDWEAGAKEIIRKIPEKITHVFSSEPHYNERFSKLYKGAKHVVIDQDRIKFPISGTQIRKNVFANWKYLPAVVQAHFVKKIAIVGTESTGKTTLTKKLAKYYDTNFVHEIGRDFCENYKNQLSIDMFDHIAMQHYTLQRQKAFNSNRLLFIDSDAIITEYYLKMYQNANSNHILKSIIKTQQFDLVLYLTPDVPWIEDGNRFAGDKMTRILNNEALLKKYRDYRVKVIIINGGYDKRFIKAKSAVNMLLKGE